MRGERRVITVGERERCNYLFSMCVVVVFSCMCVYVSSFWELSFFMCVSSCIVAGKQRHRAFVLSP